MNKTIMFLGMLAVSFANAQQGNVGVNTDAPQATLEVKPTTANLAGTTNEGIIAPKLSKTRVAAIAAPVEGTLVYVTDDAASTIISYVGTDVKVAKIDEKGYYYFDGTEWVKAKDMAQDQEWVRDSNSGIDKIYMKNVLADDEISYRRDTGYYLMNLGNLTEAQVGNTALNESPNSILISSSKLPVTLKQGIYFNFNNSSSVVNQAHASNQTPTWGKTYVGNKFDISTEEISSKINAMHGIFVNANSKASVGTQYGTLSISGLDGTNTTTVNNYGVASVGYSSAIVTNNYGGHFKSYTTKEGKATNLVGIKAEVFNDKATAGKTISSMKGADISVTSMNYFNGEYPAISLSSLIGVNSLVVNQPNTNVYNARNLFVPTTFTTNSTATYGRGIDISSTFQDGSRVDEYSSIYNNILTNGSVNIRDFYLFRFSGQTINSQTSMTNMYGFYLDDIKNGTNKNYAIYTKAGKIRFGDNVGIGVDNPTEKLEIKGAIKVSGSSTDTCDATNAGTIRFVNDKFQGCRSTGWVDLHN